MKKVSFFLAAGISVLLFSCGSGTQTEESKDTSSAAADTTSAPVTAPPVFMPFDVVRVKFKVKDYGKGYAGFISHDSIRLANGIHKYVVGRGLDGDSNMVIIISKIDDLQKTKAFYASSEIKKAMQQGGVTGNLKLEYL